MWTWFRKTNRAGAGHSGERFLPSPGGHVACSIHTTPQLFSQFASISYSAFFPWCRPQVEPTGSQQPWEPGKVQFRHAGSLWGRLHKGNWKTKNDNFPKSAAAFCFLDGNPQEWFRVSFRIYEIAGFCCLPSHFRVGDPLLYCGELENPVKSDGYMGQGILFLG